MVFAFVRPAEEQDGGARIGAQQLLEQRNVMVPRPPPQFEVLGLA